MQAIETVKSYWEDFKAGAPGERFEAFYERRREERSGAWKGVVYVVLGLGLVAVGAVLLVMPGPGLLVVALGLAIIAGESRIMARGLDVTEVKMRAAWQGWKKLRPHQQVLSLAAGTLVLLGAGVWIYSQM